MSNTEEVRKWLEEWYSVGDQCIPSNSVKWFAEDCVVRFNNAPEVHGKAAAQNEFESIAPIIAWMSHEILSFDIVGNRIYNECNVTYIVKGDPEEKKVSMHRLNVYDREEQGGNWMIMKWMAFFDSSPLKERIKAVGTEGRVY